MGRNPRRVRSRYAVRPTKDFARDVAAQVSWLERHTDPDWIVTLRSELDEVGELLAELPAAGAPAGQGLRKLILRRLPFVIRYRVHGRKVLLLRLFHVRQDRSRD